MAIKLLSSGSR